MIPFQLFSTPTSLFWWVKCIAGGILKPFLFLLVLLSQLPGVRGGAWNKLIWGRVENNYCYCCCCFCYFSCFRLSPLRALLLFLFLYLCLFTPRSYSSLWHLDFFLFISPSRISSSYPSFAFLVLTSYELSYKLSLKKAGYLIICFYSCFPFLFLYTFYYNIYITIYSSALCNAVGLFFIFLFLLFETPHIFMISLIHVTNQPFVCHTFSYSLASTAIISHLFFLTYISL